jgi:hypothetical protein
MSWEAAALPNGERHVIPLSDLRPHADDVDCWCRPTEDARDQIFVHHAMDRREDYESGKVRPA